MPSALQILCRNPKEIAMSIRSMLVAAALTVAALGAAHADGLRPIDAKSIDLGEVSGVAYYTVERDGFRRCLSVVPSGCIIAIGIVAGSPH
jgi:hypothetical protein